jgi:hypothetical protein
MWEDAMANVGEKNKVKIDITLCKKWLCQLTSKLFETQSALSRHRFKLSKRRTDPMFERSKDIPVAVQQRIRNQYAGYTRLAKANKKRKRRTPELDKLSYHTKNLPKRKRIAEDTSKTTGKRQRLDAMIQDIVTVSTNAPRRKNSNNHKNSLLPNISSTTKLTKKRVLGPNLQLKASIIKRQKPNIKRCIKMKQKTKTSPRRTPGLTYRIRGAHTSGHREHIKRGHEAYVS